MYISMYFYKPGIAALHSVIFDTPWLFECNVFLGFGSSMDSMDSRVPRLALVPPQAPPTGPTGPTGPLRGDQQSELPRSFASVNMFFNFVSV